MLGLDVVKAQIVRVPNGQINLQNASNATDGDKLGAREVFITQATNYSASLPQAIRASIALAGEYIDVGNTFFNMDTAEAGARQHRWESLKQLVGTLLGRPISFDNLRRVLIGDVPIDEAYAQFSDGQKRLFQFAVALAGTSQPGAPQIVLFDEPETSLHPEAAIKMVRQMQSAIDGQLWIATHCVPLIAALGIENVWYANNGSISYGGRRTERVINSLLGGRDNLFALREVIAEPDRIAIARFTAECLNAPEVIGTVGDRDQQLLQTAAAIGANEDGATQKNIRVLDWGCGKARLKVWLDLYRPQASKQIEYCGYEPDSKTAVVASQNSERGEGPNKATIYSDLVSLQNTISRDGLFDVIVLSNVLHEIDPVKWLETFAQIEMLLAPGGKVLLVEDGLLPVGELPHVTGFLLLDRKSCATLFNTTESEIYEQQPKDPAWKDRLICLGISRHTFSNVSNETIKACVSELSDRMLFRVSHYRETALGSEQRADYEIGHRHAIAVIQFANAKIALEKLS